MRIETVIEETKGKMASATTLKIDVTRAVKLIYVVIAWYL